MTDPDCLLQVAAVVTGVPGGTLLGVAAEGGSLARRGEHCRWVDAVFGAVVTLGGLTAAPGLIAGALSLGVRPRHWPGSAPD